MLFLRNGAWMRTTNLAILILNGIAVFKDNVSFGQNGRKKDMADLDCWSVQTVHTKHILKDSTFCLREVKLNVCEPNSVL